MALSYEAQIARQGVVTSGRWVTDAEGHVELTVQVLGETFRVKVHPDTAARFHCGRGITLKLVADGQ